MKYWLLKSDPNVWSIDQQIKSGSKGADWDGVRNYQAAKNLRNMKKGDLCFFYHSNIGKEIVGIVEVIKTSFIDPTDKTKKFVAVKVKFKNRLKSPVTLENIKKNNGFESRGDRQQASGIATTTTTGDFLLGLGLFFFLFTFLFFLLSEYLSFLLFYLFC